MTIHRVKAISQRIVFISIGKGNIAGHAFSGDPQEAPSAQPHEECHKHSNGHKSHQNETTNAINDNKGSKSVPEEEESCCCWFGKTTEKSGSYRKEELK